MHAIEKKRKKESWGGGGNLLVEGKGQVGGEKLAKEGQFDVTKLFKVHQALSPPEC